MDELLLRPDILLLCTAKLSPETCLLSLLGVKQRICWIVSNVLNYTQPWRALKFHSNKVYPSSPSPCRCKRLAFLNSVIGNIHLLNGFPHSVPHPKPYPAYKSSYLGIFSNLHNCTATGGRNVPCSDKIFLLGCQTIHHLCYLCLCGNRIGSKIYMYLLVLYYCSIFHLWFNACCTGTDSPELLGASSLQSETVSHK